MQLERFKRNKVRPKRSKYDIKRKKSKDQSDLGVSKAFFHVGTISLLSLVCFFECFYIYNFICYFSITVSLGTH